MKGLARSAYVLVVVALVLLAAGLAPWIALNRFSLPQGYLAGAAYAAVATSLVALTLNAFRRRRAAAHLRGATEKSYPKNDEQDPADPGGGTTAWFQWIALIVIALLLLEIFFPALRRSIFDQGVQRRRAIDDLPWWNPQKTPLLSTYVLGLFSIIGVGTIEALSRRVGGGKRPSDRKDVKWWRRDARTPGALLLAMVPLALGLALFTDIIEVNRSFARPWDDSSMTVVGAALFLYSLYVLLTLFWSIWLMRGEPRGPGNAPPVQQHFKLPPPIGLWDHDLDHDFTPGSRPAS